MPFSKNVTIIVFGVLLVFGGCSEPDATDEFPFGENEWSLVFGEEEIHGIFSYDAFADRSLSGSISNTPHVHFKNEDGYFKIYFQNLGVEFSLLLDEVSSPFESPFNFAGFKDTSSDHYASVKYTEPSLVDGGSAGSIFQSVPINKTEESFTLNIEVLDLTLKEAAGASSIFFIDRVKLTYMSEVGAKTNYENGVPVSNTDRKIPFKFEADFDYNAIY